MCECVCWGGGRKSKHPPRTVTQRPLKHIWMHTNTYTYAACREDAALSLLTQEVLFLSAISCVAFTDPYTHIYTDTSFITYKANVLSSQFKLGLFYQSGAVMMV